MARKNPHLPKKVWVSWTESYLLRSTLYNAKRLEIAESGRFCRKNGEIMAKKQPDT
jgi:hypothetical protein